MADKELVRYWIVTSYEIYILMIHVAKELDLSESPLSINPIIKCISNLLDRNIFLGLGVGCTTAVKFKISSIHVTETQALHGSPNNLIQATQINFLRFTWTNRGITRQSHMHRDLQAVSEVYTLQTPRKHYPVRYTVRISLRKLELLHFHRKPCSRPSFLWATRSERQGAFMKSTFKEIENPDGYLIVEAPIWE